MARAKPDPAVLAHLEWLGFVRPTGLVVSAPALVRAGAILDRRDTEGQRLLRSCLDVDRPAAPGETREPAPAPYRTGAPDPEPELTDFPRFAAQVLGWTFTPQFYAGDGIQPIPPELEVPLADYGETLRPDLAVREPEPRDGDPAWQLLVMILDGGADMDRPVRGPGRLEASPHGRMERLLRASGVPAGLLVNGRSLRLISAPRGESSGWLDFHVPEMIQTAGRPICAALRLLLGETRLLTLPRAQRLAALLADSRRFQNEVSERLAEQVLHALYELLRGFQAAHDASGGELLRQPLTDRPDEVYRALLTVILRLVFLLYAEEREMLPADGVFQRFYSLAGLYQRLREDAALHPDTMDQRYGAWAHLLVLFRLIHDGAAARALRLPRRHGVLFDPDRFPFLEGRTLPGARQTHERIAPPLVPDGTIWRALEKLLVLDGERLSYRALDVEQIGSVYETMMGFRLETATGRSVAIRSQKKRGAPAAVDLEAILAEGPTRRAKAILDRADRKLTDKVRQAVVGARSLADLHAALVPVIDLAATPDLVPPGAMVLQPSQERRRSGSHYTPRALTEPIVRTTLAPLLARLRGEGGGPPQPEQILDLKVLDPAMGSGAFLVEACRQLGDALVEAWHTHNALPTLPPDEDEVIFARRLIAQRCLYGVDRNPVAVDLAKVSLWLVTLAREHPLTFVDHALRHGDSLVGLSRRQIEAMHWDPAGTPVLRGLGLRDSVDRVATLRRQIRDAGESVTDWELRDLWDEARAELGKVRLFGDLVLAAFLDGKKAKEREAQRLKYVQEIGEGRADQYRTWLEERAHADPPLAPFHWEIEFPEVSERDNPGFDAVVGNPPFLRGARISTVLGMDYFAYLKEAYPGTAHQCDLVAHFFRRAYALLRETGVQGLLATKTISKGDTRNGGLTWICQRGGTIFAALRRLEWPGSAAVIVSVVHIFKGECPGPYILDGSPVGKITAYLFHRGGHSDPARLGKQNHLFSKGTQIYGQGFLFDDHDAKASTIAEMESILRQQPELGSRILPYIGGSEVNSDPHHRPRRYCIYLSDLREERELEQFPQLLRIVSARVRPERDRLGDNPNNIPLKKRWWAFQAHRPALYEQLKCMERTLVIANVSDTFAFTFLKTGQIFSQQLVVFTLDRYSHFACMQSSLHENWARFFGSSMKDDLRYTPSDCFETFPFPEGWGSHPALEAAGQAYYEHRAALMVRNSEGLTKTYNRFHNPEERDPDIRRLRELHADMDRAVLKAYGWDDIPTTCDFILDYEIDEEEWGTRKKPWRYRWPDEIRDEVLARLLELNAERARADASAGAAAGPRKRSRKGAQRREADTAGTKDLFS